MRAAVFAHFDIHDQVDDYVLHLLRCLRPHFDFIVFVSTSSLSIDQRSRARFHADKVICRTNSGYDFMSWRVGYEALPRHLWSTIAFMNDSCYGPLYDLSTFFTRGADLNADIWGVSLNYQIQRHLQSFFMCFELAAVRSGFAAEFWESICVCASKSELIMRFEVGLSALAESRGLKVAAVVDLAELDGHARLRAYETNRLEGAVYENDALDIILNDNSPNPMQLFWNESIARGSPLVKIEVLRENPMGASRASIIRHIKSAGWFDVLYIENHLRRILGPKYMTSGLFEELGSYG